MFSGVGLGGGGAMDLVVKEFVFWYQTGTWDETWEMEYTKVYVCISSLYLIYLYLSVYLICILERKVQIMGDKQFSMKKNLEIFHSL